DEYGDLHTDLRYSGRSEKEYRNYYLKRSNKARDDWSDFGILVFVLNHTPAEFYIHELSTLMNIDEWVRMLALDSLIGDAHGLASGFGGGFSLFEDASDSGPFSLLPRDLHSLFLQNPNHPGNVNQSIFAATGVTGLGRFLAHPEILSRY